MALVRLARLAALTLAAGLPVTLLQADPARDDTWPEDFEIKTSEVNEGELAFLAEAPPKPVHHHHNDIALPASSLRDGWVDLHQCHRHLDPVPSTQVVYNPARIRSLMVESSVRIGMAWVEDHTVQLRDIGPNAVLCLSAQSRSLSAHRDGSFTLSNGPFMRRFLDGYYPMRVTMDVQMPPDCLRFRRIEPEKQDGFEVTVEADHVYIDTWFEGRLFTEIEFVPASQGTDGGC